MRAVSEVVNPEFIFTFFDSQLALVEQSADMIRKVKESPELQLRVNSDPNQEMVEKFKQMCVDANDPTKIVCPEHPLNQTLTALKSCKHKWKWVDLGSFGAKVISDEKKDGLVNFKGECGPERLPFPHTLFTFYFDSENMAEVQIPIPIVDAVFCWEDPENPDEFMMYHFMTNVSRSDFVLASVNCLRKFGNIWKLASGSSPNQPDDLKTEAIAPTIIVEALKILNCNNVKLCEYKPTFQAMAKAKRLGRIKPFTRHTLVIGGDRKAGGVSLGGSHSSPALHFRRGHVRQYAPGKYTWVTSTMVGSSTRGEITTDYKVQANE